MNRRGFFGLIGAAVTAREAPRLVDINGTVREFAHRMNVIKPPWEYGTYMTPKRVRHIVKTTMDLLESAESL